MVHEAVRVMLDSYECNTAQDYFNALRDILQRLALLGLWRSRFFQHAAFYGGTALRLLHSLDRFSEDLDFSLMKPDGDFSLEKYCTSLKREMEGFGFEIDVRYSEERESRSIQSAMIKTNAVEQLKSMVVPDEAISEMHPGKLLKVKLDIDTDPPGNFSTGTRFLLRPFPVPVRVYELPDLFAGKLHAVLCRRWKTRVKGRDWYDMVWFASRYPKVNLTHLDARMRRSGDYDEDFPMSLERLNEMLEQAVSNLDIDAAREEVSRFVPDFRMLDVWSEQFFLEAIGRINAVH